MMSVTTLGNCLSFYAYSDCSGPALTLGSYLGFYLPDITSVRSRQSSSRVRLSLACTMLLVK